MPKFLDKLSDLSIDLSGDTVDFLNNIAQMETTDFNAVLKSVENMAGQALDSDTIINLKKHAMQLQQSIVSDGDFVSDLAEGSKLLDDLSLVNDLVENGNTAINLMAGTSEMFKLVRDENLTEAEKVELFNNKFEEFKENGADAVIAVLDSTFGSIPGVGPALTSAVEDKLRDFVTSEEGLQKISNNIGDFFDRGIENIADRTGLTDYLKKRFNKDDESDDIEFETQTPPDFSGEVTDAAVQNIAAELEANITDLFSNLEKFNSTIEGI